MNEILEFFLRDLRIFKRSRGTRFVPSEVVGVGVGVGVGVDVDVDVGDVVSS
mgnify:FL=1